jgi:SOS-response transcriptional repressor LexA
MNEKQTTESQTIRPTKKQHELLGFIEAFIAQRGYSPSYREIMTGLNYNSVATVALHVNSLIKRGQLRKRDRSARSLELVHGSPKTSLATNQVQPSQEKWLVEKVEYFFRQNEQQAILTQPQIDQLQILIGALKVLGLESAAQSFAPRLASLHSKIPTA